jgi:hypothetical protein
MTAKEIFESLDLSQLPKDAADKFRKVEKATKGFTIESEKVNTFMRGAYKKIKETKPTALKNLKVEEKIIKKEVKKGENTQVVEDLEYKVKGTKKVSKKTATPSKPKRKGETAMERARKIRKKGEAWKDVLARAQKELKAEATKAKKDAEKVVSTTSQALKSLEKMIQKDPKLKGYPRTYGKQSKRIDANKDAKIKAKPAGKRVSKKGHKNQYGESKGGRVYWENRDNRSDRYAPNFPNKVFLEMGGETDDLGFPTGHTFLVVEVSPDGTKSLIKSTTDYMTALMSSAVTRGRKTNKDNRVVIVDKEDKKVIHEAFEAGGEITITPTQIVNNPDYLVGTTTMTELFEAGGVTEFQEGGEVFVTPNPLLNAGSGDYVAGSNTMSNMFAKGGEVLEDIIVSTKKFGVEDIFERLSLDYNFEGTNEEGADEYIVYEVPQEYIDKIKTLPVQWRYVYAKGGKTQGYNDKLDESLGNRMGKETSKEQSKKDRRDESKAMEKSMGQRAYQSVSTMDKMAKGGKLPKNIKYYGVNEIKEYRLKNGDKIDASQTFVDSGIYVSATKTMKPKEKEFQQKLELASGGKINWKEDYDYIPRYEIDEVELENGKVIKGDYVVSGIYKPKSDRTKQLEKEMKARMKKMETGGTIVAADPSAAMEDLNQTYGYESVYEKGGVLYEFDIEYTDNEGDEYSESFDSLKEANDEITRLKKEGFRITRKYKYKNDDYVGSFEKGGQTLPSPQSIIDKLRSDGASDKVILDLAIHNFNDYLKRSGSYKNPRGLLDLAMVHYEIVQSLRPNVKMEKGGRLGFEGLAKKVAKRYEGKAVKPKFQEEYGKTYSKEQALEVGRKVAAKVYGQQQANMKKMAKGGVVNASRTAMEIGALTGLNKNVIQDFVDKNNLDIERLYKSVKNGSLSERMDLVTAIVGSPNNPNQKKIISDFSSTTGTMAKGGYLVRFEDEGKYETQKFATLDKAKDFYNFINEQKMNYGLQKTQLISNEDGKVLMGARDLPQLAKGGSLDGHGLQLGDKIVKDLGSVLQITTKDGGMVYVDLASGYRGKDMPLPFEKGGAVGGMKIPDIAKKFGKTTADVMKQVEIGAKHEMEHTSDAKKARKIALDHLSGDLDYYTKLNKLGL